MTQKIIMANNDNVEEIVTSEIERLGNNADINHIDVSRVTNMDRLFSYRRFNGSISNWNMSNVISIFGMFEFSLFNGDISRWNVSNVVNMNSLFSYSKFNGDISKWNVSSVKDMDFVFQGSDFIHNISDWKFHPDLKLNHDLLRVIENSYQIKAAQEAALMKNEITLMKNKILNSL